MPAPPSAPPPAHNDVFHQHDTAAVPPTSPCVLLSCDNNHHLNVVDHTALQDCRDVIAESRDDDNVAMVTARTVVVANDNDDTVARQPVASDDVRIDDVMQPMNGNENDVILIPEAMVDGMSL